MFVFYMGKYSIDFGYFSRHSPQSSGINLYSCYSKHNCTRPSSDPPPSRVIWGAEWVEWRQDGKYVTPKLQKSILLCCGRFTRCSTRTHPHLHPAPCLDSPERFVWINFPVFSILCLTRDFIRQGHAREKRKVYRATRTRSQAIDRG